MTNDKIELRSAAARLLYGNNRNSADYAMLVDYIDSSEPAQRWIPCSERLTELMQYVLCLLVSGEYRVMRRESTKYWQADFKHPYRGDLITHWMPLPEPPR